MTQHKRHTCTRAHTHTMVTKATTIAIMCRPWQGGSKQRRTFTGRRTGNQCRCQACREHSLGHGDTQVCSPCCREQHYQHHRGNVATRM